jgi:hypothetical protein
VLCERVLLRLRAALRVHVWVRVSAAHAPV